MGDLVKRVLTWLPLAWRIRLFEWFGASLDDARLAEGVRRVAASRADRLSSAEALRFLLHLDTQLYRLQGKQAVRHGSGVHVKHRLMGYHDFFVNRLQPGERVLDVGCGNGALSRDMAERGKCRVLGIDLNAEHIATACRDHAHPDVEYRLGDATEASSHPGRHEVVTLSNVLEHLSDRPAFLRRLVRRVQPERLLIRVPLFEREWRVPLKRELGVEWRLDSTHETEYTLESYREEMGEAGLCITHLEVRWGEIWAEVRPEAEESTAGDRS
ncbi:MAG: class I SAM-dependent methyltransferase [Magnetococcales bacterium]|nr:class I SAM-dependent methyltransferase [Magnetococcales bacterium]